MDGRKRTRSHQSEQMEEFDNTVSELKDTTNQLSEDLNELKEQGIGGGSGIPSAEKQNFAKAIRQEIAFVSTSHPYADSFLAWLENGGSDSPVNPPSGTTSESWQNGVAYDLGLVANKYIDQSGVEKTYSNWSVTDYLPCKGANKLYIDGVKSGGWKSTNYAGFYSEDKNTFTKVQVNAGALDTLTIDVPSNASWFRISNETSCMELISITPSNGQAPPIEDSGSNETTWTDGVGYTYEPVQNSYVETNGAITSYNDWGRTPYLYCEGASKLRITVRVESGTLSNMKYNAFYDANKSFISNFTFDLANKSVGEYTDIDIPSNTCYFICSGKQSAWANVKNIYGNYLTATPIE